MLSLLCHYLIEIQSQCNFSIPVFLNKLCEESWALKQHWLSVPADGAEMFHSTERDINCASYEAVAARHAIITLLSCYTIIYIMFIKEFSSILGFILHLYSSVCAGFIKCWLGLDALNTETCLCQLYVC